MNITSVKSVVVGSLIVLSVIAIYFLGMYLIGMLIPNSLVATIVDILFKIAIGIISILLIKFAFKMKGFTYIKKGIIYGIFVYGAMFLAYTISNLILGYSGMDRGVLEALPYIVLFFFICVGIGFVEEMLFRGLVFNFVKKVFCGTKYENILAIMISSVLFGSCHLINLIATPNMVVSTFTQVIYATIIGIYFAVIYVKTNNIVAPILLHILFDFVYYIWWAFSNEAILNSTIDINLLQGVISIALYLPMIVWSILVYKGTFDFDKK